MSPHESEGREGLQPEPVDFSFRYRRHVNVKWLYVALVAGGVVATLEAAGEGRSLLFPWIVIAGLAAGTWLLFFAMRHLKPDVPDLKWVSVSSERGLEVGRLRLSAERIGEVVEVDRRTASDAMHTPRTMTLLRCRIGERETAPWRMIYQFWHQYPAVWVEDLEAADHLRRWWLLAVPEHVDQGEFAAALRAVRRAGGDEEAEGA